MTRKERIGRFVEYFSVHQPVAETELVYRDPYELVVAVILSAQCTDKRVNMITPLFFEKFGNFAELANASEAEVFGLVRSCSYPNSKTRHLLQLARKVMEDYDGKLPDDTDELQKLPGVGRKTAHVVASVAFNQPKMAVDTHVFRVSERIGLTWRAKNPLQTEQQLVEHIPEAKIPLAHHWLILHGRYICQARKPKCDQCGIKDFCRYFEKRHVEGQQKPPGIVGKD
jgi:endonuclease-3